MIILHIYKHRPVHIGDPRGWGFVVGLGSKRVYIPITFGSCDHYDDARVAGLNALRREYGRLSS